MTGNTLIADAAALLGELTATRNEAASGRPIDLATLDLRVFAVVDAVLAMPRPEAQQFLPLLEDLRRALDALCDAVKAAEPDHA